MAMSDAALFHESLKLWDRPNDELGADRALLRPEDDVERMVDDMFRRFMALDPDRDLPGVGNC